MKARLLENSYNVSAFCSNCNATTSFEHRETFVVNGSVNFENQPYVRRLNILNQCAGCHRGGFALVADRGHALNAALMEFYPTSAEFIKIPEGTPPDIAAEFREAERCASMGFNRAASALFRSTLEKILKANGYTKGNDSSLRDLQKRIDAATVDGIITKTRQKRAHEDIRSLGNDVLHDDWRAVDDGEVDNAHRYTQRIIEDFYDDRPTVEKTLIEAKRLLSIVP